MRKTKTEPTIVKKRKTSSKNNKTKKLDPTTKEVESLKKKLNISEKTSKKKKKEESPEVKAEKKRIHVEKISKKQEARLPNHIERINRKEAKGQPANKERFYVTNAKLLEELSKMPKGPDGKILEGAQASEEFGKMIKMIAERLTNHSNFKNYPFDLKQDMASYACFKCIQGIHNYNFEFKNAFAYFTTACYNAFVSTISKYYKDKNLKKDIAKKAIEKLESTSNINANKILSQFIKDYLGDLSDEDKNKKGKEEEDGQD